MATRVAVDIGGTFTDVVVFDSEHQRLVIGKTLSTPDDLITGIKTGLGACGANLASADLVIHGSTVVINALVQRRGVATALITTRGFRDVYEIGRINRPDSFNLNFDKHEPLVPRRLIYEVDERMLADGRVGRPLQQDAVAPIAEQLRAAGVESVAVVFLHSYRNPQHEIEFGARLAAELPTTFITLSHELSREYREFERTSTTVANAFVGPIVADYLDRLEAEVTRASATAELAIMQSNGGLADADTIRRQCVQMMESGPAGGVVGVIAACKQLGLRDAIAFDIGGTTSKASVIRNLEFPYASDYFVGGYNSGLPIRIPTLDIVEVGAGGGSMAWLDEAGGFHVGPQSAGASPGPACYAGGGVEPTVTDAAVCLGFLDGTAELAGGLQLNGRLASVAVGKLAGSLGIDELTAAAGILDVATASMANAVRGVTTSRGLDPRDFTLFAYGGNGPLLVSRIARELGISRVVVPPASAVFSAVGMLSADLRRDVVQTRVQALDAVTAEELEEQFVALEAECAGQFIGSDAAGPLIFIRSADMRYVGQEHTVQVDLPTELDADAAARIKRRFDEAHEVRFSHSAENERAEIVSLRLTGVRPLDAPVLPGVAQGKEEPPADAHLGRRELVFDASVGSQSAELWSRERLVAGNRIAGPAVIVEGTASTVLQPGDVAQLDGHGFLVISVGGPHD